MLVHLFGTKKHAVTKKYIAHHCIRGRRRVVTRPAFRFVFYVWNLIVLMARVQGLYPAINRLRHWADGIPEEPVATNVKKSLPNHRFSNLLPYGDEKMSCMHARPASMARVGCLRLISLAQLEDRGSQSSIVVACDADMAVPTLNPIAPISARLNPFGSTFCKSSPVTGCTGTRRFAASVPTICILLSGL